MTWKFREVIFEYDAWMLATQWPIALLVIDSVWKYQLFQKYFPTDLAGLHIIFQWVFLLIGFSKPITILPIKFVGAAFNR